MAFIEKSYDLDALSLSISVGGEDSPTELEFSTAELSDEIKQNLLMHGLSQKLGDSAASVKAKLTKELGREPNADEHRAAVIEAINGVWAQLENGDWRAARGEGEAKPRIGEVALAIARLRNMDVAEVQTLLAATDKEKIKTWRKHPQVQGEIAKIRAERAAERLQRALAAQDANAEFNPFA